MLALALASARSSPKGGPRDIPQRDRGELNSDSERDAGAATGSGRIYLLTPEVPGSRGP
jgi:hypothetical protein